MNMVSLLLLSLISVVVDVELTDGQRLSGDLVGLSDEQLDLSNGPDGKPRAIPRTGLKSVQFSDSKEVRNPAAVFVQLVDDSVVPCDSVLLEGGELRVNQKASNSWTAKDSLVRAVRWLQPEKTDEQWNQILGRSESDDLLVIRRDLSLDYLKGVILGVTEQAVQFEYLDRTIPVPMSKAAGFILSRQPQEKPVARIQLATRDGGLWMLQSLVLKKSQFELKSMAGVTATIPASDVARLRYPQLGIVFLSELEPVSVQYEPYFGSQLDDTLKQLYGPQLDQSMDGVVLRLRDEKSVSGWRMFRRGLAMQSRTEVVYRLAGKYQRFRASAGVDPDSKSQADVQLKLFADDREIFNRTFVKSDPIVEVDVDVAGAKRLTLLVDYGANLDIGDRIHLGDARLVK